jgi:RNA polymerase sigma-70 factor (ECF subfamily)
MHRVDSLPQHAVSNGREALDKLFDRYRRRLFNTALRLLGNSDDAEDALQDALLAALRNLDGFKGRSQIYTWLTRIVINAALMRLRRMHLDVMTSIDAKLDRENLPLAHRIPDPGPNPEEVYARQERVAMLERRLQLLPASYRQVVWLCDIQGLKAREAAEALGLSIGTVKSQLHRARLRLSEEVAEARLARRALHGTRCKFAITRYQPTSEFTEKLTQPAA